MLYTDRFDGSYKLRVACAMSCPQICVPEWRECQTADDVLGVTLEDRANMAVMGLQGHVSSSSSPTPACRAYSSHHPLEWTYDTPGVQTRMRRREGENLRLHLDSAQGNRDPPFRAHFRTYSPPNPEHRCSFECTTGTTPVPRHPISPAHASIPCLPHHRYQTSAPAGVMQNSSASTAENDGSSASCPTMSPSNPPASRNRRPLLAVDASSKASTAS